MILPGSRLEGTVPRRVNNSAFIFPEDQLWAGLLLLSWPGSARLCHRGRRWPGILDQQDDQLIVCEEYREAIRTITFFVLEKTTLSSHTPWRAEGFSQGAGLFLAVPQRTPVCGWASDFSKEVLPGNLHVPYLINLWNPDRNPYNCYFTVGRNWVSKRWLIHLYPLANGWLMWD